MANILTDETGFIRLVNKADQTKWLLFLVTQVNPESGYYNVFGTVLASSDANPFVNADAVLLCYSKNGVPGADGPPGADGAPGSNATVPDIQVFVTTGSNTWNKPAGAVTVDRYLIGGGGGGGSGRCGATSSNRPGGGGGGGGGYSHDSNAASKFGSSETVTVGAAGAGGAGVVPTNDGNAGSAGGNTSMTASGTGGATLTANGGGGGGAGTVSVGGGAAGGGGTGATANGASGGAGTFGAVAFDGGDSAGRMAGGGGGGATGINASNTIGVYGGWGGSSGGSRTRRNLSLAANAATGAQPILTAADGGDGQCIIAGTTPVAFGGAGGGGGATALQFATSFVGTAFGGRGGRFGGGGGGGAGYTNNVTVSNDGFAGGDGVAIIVTTF
ncbi:glycine-rich domain-containing protein [Lacipirellula sp.]|uniref:glycine-rich domain-containing protein n=1 Tax=Lacipirellula sp. TaxID=2691419 RepID=UPI003D0AA6E5